MKNKHLPALSAEGLRFLTATRSVQFVQTKLLRPVERKRQVSGFHRQFAAEFLPYELFMNALFETYGPSYRIGESSSGLASGEPDQEARLPVTAVLAMLCLASVAFNVRFLVALRKERKALRIERARNPGTARKQESVDRVA